MLIVVQISIPLIEQLLTVNQFKTVCYSSKVPYTSVIDISGSLYALNGASSVDQLKIEEKAQQFSVVQTVYYFQCYLCSTHLTLLIVEQCQVIFQLLWKHTDW